MKAKLTRLLLVIAASFYLSFYPERQAKSLAVSLDDPGADGPCAITSQSVTINGSFTARIYYPTNAACGTWTQAPYPGVVFAHGFSMFGFSDGVAENAGNGEHLARWGYVVAIPNLPDDATQRLANLRSTLDYLIAQSNQAGSPLLNRVDIGRLATAGHSLGGSTALAAAAHDSRVKVAVALDPVYHSGVGDLVWDPQADGPLISVPTLILGAPGSSCNANGDFATIYPLIAARHRASVLISNASHCDFTDPGSQFCGFICGSTNSNRTQLSQRYMTAWLNYYLHLKADQYTYLYGAQAALDVQQGLTSIQFDTRTRFLWGNGYNGMAQLTWSVYDHPIIAGYNVYRRQSGQSYPTTPLAQLGNISAFTDNSVSAGQVYSYTVASFDLVGNLHQTADEVGVWITIDPPPRPDLFLPFVSR